MRAVLSAADVGYVAVAVVAIAGLYLGQAVRWRAIGRTPTVSTAHFGEMVVSGVTVNDVLPGRIGDLLRARLLQVAARIRANGRSHGFRRPHLRRPRPRHVLHDLAAVRCECRIARASRHRRTRSPRPARTRPRLHPPLPPREGSAAPRRSRTHSSGRARHARGTRRPARPQARSRPRVHQPRHLGDVGASRVARRRERWDSSSLPSKRCSSPQ